MAAKPVVAVGADCFVVKEEEEVVVAAGGKLRQLERQAGFGACSEMAVDEAG